MSADLPIHAPHSRPLGALAMAGTCGLFGVLVGALEGRWIGVRESFPLDAFTPELLLICLHYAALFGGLGLILGLVRAWQKPERVLCGLTMLAAVWILPYQASNGWVTGVGLALLAALSWLYLRSTRRMRCAFLLADALLALALLAGLPSTITPPPSPAAAEDGSAPATLPDIVVVVIDTLRADHLSCYGYRPEGPPNSPVIDGLAASGTRFEKAYAQAPWTRPSTASLFTGLYPASHGIVTPYDPLGADLPTIATMLRARGYSTVGFSANPQVAPAFGFHQGFQRFWNSTTHIEDLAAGVRLARKLGIGSARPTLPRGVPDSTADDVNHAISRWLQGAREEGPTFLYVHYLDPHDPYSAPANLLGLPAGPEVDEQPLYASQDLPPFPIDGSRLPGLEGPQLAELERRYDTEIAYVDDRLGSMLEELRESGLVGTEDYLILTSDHGEEFHEHHQWQHGRSLFEEMIHVPLVVLGPDVPRGRLHADPVELVDILPTIASWSGGPAVFSQHGEILFGSREKSGAFAHRPREKFPIWSLRSGTRKLIWVLGEEGPVAMAFDLARDPGETEALAEMGGTEFATLRRRLSEMLESSGEFRRERVGAVQLDDAAARSLQQLGYIDAAEEE